MKKRVFLLLLVSISFAFAAAAPAQQQKKVDVASELQSLVRTERNFASAAAAKGTREAFLENLADDGIIFRPGPVNGKKFLSERPQGSGLLSWEPVYTDVSRSGDLGYTTGPWEFRPKGSDDRPVAQGQFMTIWKKQPDGVWKFVLDLGTQNPPPNVPPPALEFPADFRKNKPQDKMNSDVVAEQKALLKLEREFARDSTSKGTPQAFARYAADDLRLMREGNFPVLGKQAAIAALSKRPGDLVWQPTFADVSRSGDLGYSYGTYSFGGKGSDVQKSEKGNYVRIWKKRDGKWRVVLDLLNPVPPAKD